MERFAEAIDQSVSSGNWLGALTLALAMPDICGRLQWPGDRSGRRYDKWWDSYMLRHYQLEIAGSQHVFLSGSDAYALRCAVLHEGGADVSRQSARRALERFHFVAPRPNRHFHRNQVDGVLQLQVDVFCTEMSEAVRQWDADHNADQDVQARKADLIKIHSTDGFFRLI